MFGKWTAEIVIYNLSIRFQNATLLVVFLRIATRATSTLIKVHSLKQQYVDIIEG